MQIERRRMLLAAAAGAALLAGRAGAALAAAAPSVTIYKNVACGCCGGWVEHVSRSGFEVRVVDVPDVSPYRRRLGVPDELASCHTAEIGGYAVEGHVPAADIRRLLRERPFARGLALPGMVPSSPGMDGPRTPYATILFSTNGGSAVFARH